jgi:hypothetical protein
MAYSKKQKQKFLEVLRSKNFNVSKACKDFKGMSRNTYTIWLQEEWFKNEIDDMLEEEIDESEEVHRILRKGIPKVENRKLVGWEQRPDRKAIEFFLSTKAKERGYVKRIEQTGKDGKPLVPNKFKVVIKKKVD